MKHTQGKWYVNGIIYPTIESRNEDSKEVITYPTIATVNHSFIAEQEYRANAKLIASAPTLLEALKECRDTLVLLTLLDKSDATANSIKIAENAIKQATE